MDASPLKVVVIGAGFGGLEVAHRLARANVEILVIDQRNHHLFQPLLYQVATAALATSEIAWPIRHLLRRDRHTRTLLGTVTAIDKLAKTVTLADGATFPFDVLIVATGARHAYFGHDEWEPHAPGLKTLEDATTIRRRLLTAFERAERESDPARQAALLTFVIVGAGPTGVELAGTIAELAHNTLPSDFRNFDSRRARVLLVEAGPRVLANFRPELSEYSRRALEKLGVEVVTGRAVSRVDAEGVTLGEEHIPAATVIWAAGVQASPAALWLDVPADRAGRVKVEPDLTVPGAPDIFVIGDTAMVMSNGAPVPGVAPAAKQQGRHVAQTILARLKGDRAPRPFHYRHQGSLATIGRRAAVVDFGRIRLTGGIAWWTWGLAHIFFLIGVRNRLAVALNWLWIHSSGSRSARLITQRETPASTQEPVDKRA
ncbi:NAD(P)/FAD-dependent oxidoreductase [Kaistia dalseonensis]|uniref:NADH:ubiquinone reductase (non-electrogenic) n=1 Tax=Kaistia dalseonensis TaxID=410840 RepID=A0ABU0HC56_9HYPH|nr:NAD(P)/FAD-dependent oxidoreductase [Kaistia dalseonensis]MCX5497258.1 NAD(P)/FAD-dependent oxidoreductase [Kaistia dalseonensis]MDQ0439894.1 NADH dehydrogenase [Kaistia dalseonensis]